jgi:hypothetical protein
MVLRERSGGGCELSGLAYFTTGGTRHSSEDGWVGRTTLFGHFEGAISALYATSGIC